MYPLLARRLTASYALPVELELLKIHLKVDSTEEDAYIEGLAVAASQVWEERVRQPVMQADYVAVSSYGPRELRLPTTPTAITRVDYLTQAGEVAVLPAANYVSSVLWPDSLVFADTTLNPFPVVGHGREAYRVYFTAGAVTPAEVPPVVRQFIYLLVAHWYENRQEVIPGVNGVQQIPLGAQALIDLEREPVL